MATFYIVCNDGGRGCRVNPFRIIFFTCSFAGTPRRSRTWPCSQSPPSSGPSRTQTSSLGTIFLHQGPGYRVVFPNFGHPVLTSSLTKYKLLQVKNSFATIVNGLSVLKLFYFSNGKLLFSMPHTASIMYGNLE